MNQLIQSTQIDRLNSINKSAPTGKVSDRYRHVNTVDVVRGLESQGFIVSGVQAKKSSAHIVRLRHVDARPIVSNNPNLNGLIPEVVMRSAYDGTSAFTLTAGVFRIVCANGLIVGSGLVERIIHIGDAVNKTAIAAARITQDLPRMIDGIERMGAVTLDGERRLEFARQASDIILGDSLLRSEFTASQLLTPYRRDDRSLDLWTIFNVIQENAMKGRFKVLKGQPINFRGSSVHWYAEKARAITAVDRVFQVNRELWSLAESFAS